MRVALQYVADALGVLVEHLLEFLLNLKRVLLCHHPRCHELLCHVKPDGGLHHLSDKGVRAGGLTGECFLEFGNRHLLWILIADRILEDCVHVGKSFLGVLHRLGRMIRVVLCVLEKFVLPLLNNGGEPVTGYVPVGYERHVCRVLRNAQCFRSHAGVVDLPDIFASRVHGAVCPQWLTEEGGML